MMNDDNGKDLIDDGYSSCHLQQHRKPHYTISSQSSSTTTISETTSLNTDSNHTKSYDSHEEEEAVNILVPSAESVCLDSNSNCRTTTNNSNITTTNQQTKHHHYIEMHRHLSLFDLVSLGVGGTIGSGIFVLCGFIAHNYAGPSTCISWTISGLAACLSGLSYAELSCRIPTAGSSYIYVHASMGELPAFLVASCLTLEYLVSASAVARSWGDKLMEYMKTSLGMEEVLNDEDSILYTVLNVSNRYNFNPLAMIVSMACIGLLLSGVKESKNVTNFFTMMKLSLVLFMAIMGLVLMKPKENLTPFLPPEFGISGILRGATSSFFGYIGFDEICCMAGETMNPQRNIPLAIILTLGLVTSLYIIAALALTGMQSYEDISDISGFPYAFSQRGVNWASQLTAFGEVFTLPIVVLIGIMAQPRLQYALARDGLLPDIFAQVDVHGNLWFGTVISGIIMILIATFIPFTHLNDAISTGIMVAFSMTNSALILLRHESPDSSPKLAGKLVSFFNLSSFIFCVALSHFSNDELGLCLIFISLIVMLTCAWRLYSRCPPCKTFGGKHIISHHLPPNMCMNDKLYFKVPWVPFLPCLGILVNWYLIAQLEMYGILLLLGYLTSMIILYFCYGASHGRNHMRETESSRNRNDEGEYTFVRPEDSDFDGIQLPRIT